METLRGPMCRGGQQGEEEVRYYFSDAIGSVRMVTKASGQVLERYDYRPFGERWRTACPVQHTKGAARPHVGTAEDLWPPLHVSALISSRWCLGLCAARHGHPQQFDSATRAGAQHE